MASTYDISAGAKLNLYLKVCGSMPNGYHMLNTLMQEISLCDDISITIDDDRKHAIETECVNCAPIPNEKNLCYKAAVRFFSALKKKGITRLPFVSIKMKKSIPSEAGLGGGSSDAAAVILALNDHFEEPFSVEELNTIAANTGADTPFFLYGGTCFCEGIGEVITPAPSLSEIPLILIKPASGVSTPRCFAAFDERGVTSFDPKAYEVLKNEILSGKPVGEIFRSYRDLFTNDLEVFAKENVSDIELAERLLDEAGAGFSMMSGSGSCVFGVFDDIEKRDLAYGKILESDIVSSHKMMVYSCESV